MAEEIVKDEEVKEATTAPVDAAVEVSTEAGAPAVAPVKRKKAKRNVSYGQIHVLATFNNTIVTVTDEKGNSLAASSAGSSGFRGSKTGTAYAAQVAAEKAVNEAKQSYGLSRADVYVKGVGMGRDAAIRTLINQKVAIESIKDVTGVPHGGVRPRKAKRN